MRLFTNLAFAVLLVLAGGARCWWSDNSAMITASADKARVSTLAEAVENYQDDRVISPVLLFSSLTSPYTSPFAGLFISQTWEKICVSKDNSRIYKLNSSFLI